MRANVRQLPDAESECLEAVEAPVGRDKTWGEITLDHDGEHMWCFFGDLWVDIEAQDSWCLVSRFGYKRLLLVQIRMRVNEPALQCTMLLHCLVVNHFPNSIKVSMMEGKESMGHSM